MTECTKTYAAAGHTVANGYNNYTVIFVHIYTYILFNIVIIILILYGYAVIHEQTRPRTLKAERRVARATGLSPPTTNRRLPLLQLDCAPCTLSSRRTHSKKIITDRNRVSQCALLLPRHPKQCKPSSSHFAPPGRVLCRMRITDCTYSFATDGKRSEKKSNAENRSTRSLTFDRCVRRVKVVGQETHSNCYFFFCNHFTRDT